MNSERGNPQVILIVVVSIWLLQQVHSNSGGLRLVASSGAIAIIERIEGGFSIRS